MCGQDAARAASESQQPGQQAGEHQPWKPAEHEAESQVLVQIKAQHNSELCLVSIAVKTRPIKLNPTKDGGGQGAAEA